MKSKNKNLFLKIYIPFVIITIIALIVLQILGSRNRIGYLTDFNLNIERTLELNNLKDIGKDFTIDGKLDEESIKNYLLVNEDITNYVYQFRIRYYDKVFRNSDIYGVYPDLSGLPDYMENAEMEEGGSPYGNFISDMKTIEEDKVDNINYILKVKYDIIIFILVLLIILIINLFKIKNKLKLYIFIPITIFIIINVINYFNYSLNKFIIFFIISLIFSLFFFIFYLFAEKKNMKIELYFLISFLLIGFLYFILLPFTQVPDETNHFRRAYEIANGYLISDKNQSNYGGRLLPKEFQDINRIQSYKELIQNIKNNQELSGNKEFILFPNTSLYLFVSYIPQSIGIFFGKIFTDNIYLLAYFGRLFNFIFFVLVYYLTIIYAPIKKISLYLIAFLPMTLQESVSLSVDPIVIACSFLLLSLCLDIKYREEDKIITLKEILLIYLLTIFVAGSKIVYLPICFIILIIPKQKFKYNKLFYIIPILTISILINIIWMKISLSYSSPNPEMNSNNSQQIHFILNNIFDYLFIFLKTIFKEYKFYIRSMIGRDLAWYNIHISDISYYIFLGLLTLLLLFENNNKSKEINIKIKCIIFIIILLTIGLMFTAIYVNWSPVGNNIIVGIQGRYFIPVLFYIFILFSNDKLKIDFETIRIHIFIILSMSNLLVLNKIFDKFFN